MAARAFTPSMSRWANPLDNALMESFFHTLKTELVHHRTYATRDEAKRDLFAYAEGFYNRQRPHSALDYRTPDQAERQTTNIAQPGHGNPGGSHRLTADQHRAARDAFLRTWRESAGVASAA